MSSSQIYLRTGLPGAGKTLLTIAELLDLSKREPGTAIYTSGVNGINVPGWLELDDATKWHELPPNSVVFIDEAQRVFRPRGTGASVPQHVAELETIRHKGIRMYLTTQHPKLLDANVRRLTGDHRHYIRAFGTSAVSCHQWAECYPDPDGTRANSVQSMVQHPKHVYALYKSAEVHTIKRKVPLRLILGFLTIPVAIGCIWLALSWFTHRSTPSKAPENAPVASQTASGSTNASKTGPTLTPGEWLALRTPRVPGLAYTAPIYDEVTKPTTAPFPAGCILLGPKCSCYTEQATVLDVDEKLCRQIVERGMFKDFGESPARMQTAGRDGAHRATAPAPGPAARPSWDPAPDVAPMGLTPDAIAAAKLRS